VTANNYENFRILIFINRMLYDILKILKFIPNSGNIFKYFIKHEFDDYYSSASLNGRGGAFD